MAEKTLPPGYKDEAAFIEEARERFQQAVDFDRENRDEGLQDLKFLAGEQWDDDAKARRRGRPMLTINTLPAFVAQVVGDIRINRPAIRVRPAEDADKDLAEVREGLIRAIERQSDAQGVYANSGQNQVGGGIGNFRIGLKYASDDGFDRDVTISAIPNAFAVTWDPYATERTGKDARYCFVSDMVPRAAFEAKYGSDRVSDLEVPTHDVDGWYTQDSVRVTEYWLIKEAPRPLALLDGGVVLDADKVPPGAKVLRTRDSVRRTACMYLITGKEILAGPFELPVDRVPVIRVQGWEVNIGDKRVRWGLVRFARDPQRLKNYWRSVSAEVLALAGKGKWLLHEQNEGDAEELKDAIQNDESVVVWTGAVKPEFVGPPSVNAAVLQEAALNAQDMKDVTGLHDASLGAKSNETSGKAILARQREGDVSTFIYHDNLHAAIEEGGRVINQLIDVAYDTARTIRVLGEDSSTKVQRINDPDDPSSIDINRGKYDIAVETGPSFTTRRVEAAETLMQLVQSVPQIGQVGGDIMVRSLDMPHGDELADRIKRTLPPQIVAEEGEDLSPEEQQQRAAQAQAAQEQQAMQQEAAMADIHEKKGRARKTNAEADKAEADAEMARFSLAQANGQIEQMAAVMAAQTLFGPGIAPPQDYPAAE